MRASRRRAGASDRYVVAHSPPKLWPRMLHGGAPSSARVCSASRTIASARKCSRYPACSGAVRPGSAPTGVERPVPRWSSMSTRKSSSARSSQPGPLGLRVGREPSWPGPPCRKRSHGRSRPSGSAISRAKTVMPPPSGRPWSSGTANSCSVSRSPLASTAAGGIGGKLLMRLSSRKQTLFEISSHQAEKILREMTEVSTVIRVLVADDFPMVRDALSSALDRHPHMEVAGTAADGLEAVEQAHALQPDVIVMDLRTPGMSGLMALTRLTTELPHIRVLLLTACDEPDAVIDAVSAGAAGFVTKRIGSAELAEAVCAVHRGEPVVDPALTAHLVRGLRREENGHNGLGAGRLTGSELNVLRLVADGATDKQISKSLYISPRTVQSHLAQIRTKVGLRRRVELTRWAAEHLVT